LLNDALMDVTLQVVPREATCVKGALPSTGVYSQVTCMHDDVLFPQNYIGVWRNYSIESDNFVHITSL